MQPIHTKEGQKVFDVSELIDVFQAEEGSVESYTGSVGEGKTYGATRRAIHDLQRGQVVYTNWYLVLDDFNGDERTSFWSVFRNLVLGRSRFYNIDIKKNWHYFDFDDENTWVIETAEGRKIRYDSVVDFIANLTDCIVYLDEGQDIFDSYEGTNMSKKKRKTITRTRHLHKTLVVISQRYQAIPPTARANIKTFYKHVKVMAKPWLRFKVYATSEIDNNHMPIFDLEAKSFDAYWASKKILKAYNSYYLSNGIPKSQSVHFEAYDFSFLGKIKLLSSFFTLPHPLKRWGQRMKEKVAVSLPILAKKWPKIKTLGVKSESSATSIKINKSKLSDLLPVDQGKTVNSAPDRVGSKHLIDGGTDQLGIPF